MMSTLRHIFQKTLPVILALATAFVFNACNQQSKQDQDNVTKEDVKNEMQEAAATTKKYLSEEKQEMVENYQQRLDKIENQIETFKGKMESASASVAESYQSSVDKLESRYATVEQEVKELKNSSEAAWDELKEGVDYVVDYNIGQLTIRNDAALVPGADLKITYEQNDLFQLASKTLLGARGLYEFSDKTQLGFTIMNLNQQILSGSSILDKSTRSGYFNKRNVKLHI